MAMVFRSNIQIKCLFRLSYVRTNGCAIPRSKIEEHTLESRSQVYDMILEAKRPRSCVNHIGQKVDKEAILLDLKLCDKYIKEVVSNSKTARFSDFLAGFARVWTSP
jgi:hypothetical protein